MTLHDFSMMNVLGAAKAAELVQALNETTGDTVIGVWDASTGFAVRVFTVQGLPFRWYICGPLDREQARQELTGQTMGDMAAEAAPGVH